MVVRRRKRTDSKERNISVTKLSDGRRTSRFGSDGSRKAFLDLSIELMLVRGDGQLDTCAILRVTEKLHQLTAVCVAPVHARSGSPCDHLHPVVNGRIGAIDQRDRRTILTNFFYRWTAFLRTCRTAHMRPLKRTGKFQHLLLKRHKDTTMSTFVKKYHIIINKKSSVNSIFVANFLFY